jgi:hypothetical protein
MHILLVSLPVVLGKSSVFVDVVRNGMWKVFS